MSLVRLAYVSTSLLADDPNNRRQVADILLASRRNNAESDVTGALLATDRNFAQVLEGEREAVETAYERIARDKRHKDIVLTSMNRSRREGSRVGLWPISGRRKLPNRPWRASRAKFQDARAGKRPAGWSP